MLSWDRTDNAQGYIVTIEDYVLETEKLEWEFDITDYIEAGKTCSVTIAAKGDGERYSDSVAASLEIQPKKVSKGLSYEFSEKWGGYLAAKGKNTDRQLVFPDRFNNVPIVGVSAGGFYGATLKTVTFSEGMRAICSDGFYGCAFLEWVTFPATMEYLGSNAFRDCSKVTEVNLDGIKEMYSLVFCNTSIESFFVPASMEIMNAHSLSTGMLKEIKVDENNEFFTAINGNLYSKDKKTFMTYAGGKTDEEFIVPDFVTLVARGAFRECGYLKKIVFHDGITDFVKEQNNIYSLCLCEYCPELTELVLPKGIKELNATVSECKKLKFIEFKDGLETITNIAVSHLDSVVLPTSLKSMEGLRKSSQEPFTIYYGGTSEAWAAIPKPDRFNKATIYFYSETAPKSEGNFWHYGTDGKPIVWNVEDVS